MCGESTNKLEVYYSPKKFLYQSFQGDCAIFDLKLGTYMPFGYTQRIDQDLLLLVSPI